MANECGQSSGVRRAGVSFEPLSTVSAFDRRIISTAPKIIMHQLNSSTSINQTIRQNQTISP
jgi:hypothetical protein